MFIPHFRKHWPPFSPSPRLHHQCTDHASAYNSQSPRRHHLQNLTETHRLMTNEREARAPTFEYINHTALRSLHCSFSPQLPQLNLNFELPTTLRLFTSSPHLIVVVLPDKPCHQHFNMATSHQFSGLRVQLTAQPHHCNALALIGVTSADIKARTCFLTLSSLC
jgi:hypothetical protein